MAPGPYGLMVEAVTAGGPATKLESIDGTVSNFSLQPGDRIVVVDQKPVPGQADWDAAVDDKRHHHLTVLHSDGYFRIWKATFQHP